MFHCEERLVVKKQLFLDPVSEPGQKVSASFDPLCLHRVVQIMRLLNIVGAKLKLISDDLPDGFTLSSKLSGHFFDGTSGFSVNFAPKDRPHSMVV